MFQHYWTILAKKSHIDGETNALIVGEILENIRIDLPSQLKEKFTEEIATHKKIMVPFDFELISFFGSKKPNYKFQILVEMEFPSGYTEKINEVKISTGDTGKIRQRLRSNGIAVAETGNYLFKIYDITDKNKKKLIEIPLYIEIRFV